MANSIKNLLQGYTKGIRITAILILLLTGVNNAQAADASNAIVYYDNTASNWSDVQILIGHSTWSSVYTLSKISGTNNLYCNTSLSWGSYSEFYFVTGASTWGDEGSSPTHRTGYVTNYSAKKTTSLGSNKYLYVSSGTSKGASLTETKLNNGYSDLNYTQTVQQHLSTDGGTNYSASTTALATVKVSSNKLNGNSSTTSSSGTIASGSSSTTCSAARTATVTYAVSSLKTGYTFVGWYDGTTQKSTATTYNALKATGVKTITARFKANSYTVKFEANGGTGTMSNQSYAYGVSKALTANTFTRTGYTFAGWNTKADGSGTKYDDKASVKNLSSTNGATVTLYAQWSQITYTVKWVVNKDETTELVAHGSKVADAPAIDPTDLPCGDKFVGWTTSFYVHATDAPATLYPTAADIPAVIGDVTYYAVFADYEN